MCVFFQRLATPLVIQKRNTFHNLIIYVKDSNMKICVLSLNIFIRGSRVLSERGPT